MKFMSVIWYKAWFDLWGHKVRTLLAVLSIAAGIFAVGSFFGMVDELLSGMDKAHEAVYPSHINMVLDDAIDQETLDGLKNIRGVADIEPANRISVQFKTRPDGPWEAGLLTMRDDYTAQRYDILPLKEGAWPEDNRIGIERLSQSYFHLNLGDRIIFKMDGTDRVFTINGKLRHPFVLPPTYGGPAYFFIDAKGMERFGIPRGQFRELFIRVEPYSETYAKEVASAIKKRLTQEGITIWLTRYQDPHKHWGRFMVSGGSFVLRILAVLSLGMSVVLIYNTLAALIAEQTHQIGIVKAVGGYTGTILKVYLAEVLVYGLLALVIALPAGIYMAFYGTRFMLNLFNIDYEVIQLAPRAVALQILTALMVPSLAALLPILKGAGLTVREAIATYGLSEGFGASRFDQLLERYGQRRLKPAYALALGNMFRRKRRLILTQGVLIAAGVMFLAVMALNKSLLLTLHNDMQRRAFDVRVGFDQKYRTEKLLAITNSFPETKEAQVWFAHDASILHQGQRLREAGAGIEIVGLPVGQEMYQPLIVAGRWLRPDDGLAIVISKDTADDHHFKVGDVVTLDLGELGDAPWQIVGIFQATYEIRVVPNPVYAPLEAVYKVTKKYYHGNRLYVRTHLHDEAAQRHFARQLQAAYEDRCLDINAILTTTTVQDRRNAEQQFNIAVAYLSLLATIVAVVGGIGLMGALSISVVERIREIGVMRAIGASSTQIIGMFLFEGVLQGMFSWVAAVPISYFAAQPIARQLGQIMLSIDLEYRYDLTAVGVWLALIILIAILASLVPAVFATQISVRKSLAYNG